MLVTTGFSSQAERQINLWDMSGSGCGSCFAAAITRAALYSLSSEHNYNSVSPEPIS